MTFIVYMGCDKSKSKKFIFSKNLQHIFLLFTFNKFLTLKFVKLVSMTTIMLDIMSITVYL